MEWDDQSSPMTERKSEQEEENFFELRASRALKARTIGQRQTGLPANGYARTL